MSSNVAFRTVGWALALAVCGNAAECAAASRDWKANPAIVQLDTQEAVFAIGDPHGDWQRLAMVLKGAKLIENTSWDKIQWTGGHAVLVIIGDLIDKGPNSIGVITLVRALQKDAAAQGGRVIITMGNHEAEFLAKPGGSKTKEFSNELTKAHLDPQKVGSCDGDIGQFLCALPIAVRVNDWFFGHAGNTGGRTIDRLENDIDTGAQNGFNTPELIGPNSILEARLNSQGPNHLPWIYNGDPKTNPQTLLAQYTAALMTTEPKVKHLVQGHQYTDVKFLDGVTRNGGQFFQRYGLLFLIDTGMSIGITNSNNSGGGALRITGSGSDQKAIVICPNGEETTFWPLQKPDYKEQFCSR